MKDKNIALVIKNPDVLKNIKKPREVKYLYLAPKQYAILCKAALKQIKGGKNGK